MPTADESFQKIYNRIVPFVIIIPVVFLLFFIVVSMIQLQKLNTRIEEGQSTSVKEMLSNAFVAKTQSEQYNQFVILATLEEESLGERYQQGHYSLVSRSFKLFLGFFTGIIMVIVGAVFILLKLKEKVDLDVSKESLWKGSLRTSSPGVAFGVVGAILIGISSLSKDSITIRDSGLYLTKEYLVAPYFSTLGSKTSLTVDSKATLEKYLKDLSAPDASLKIKVMHPPQTDSTPSGK